MTKQPTRRHVIQGMAAAAALTSAAARTARADDPITIKFSHVVADKTPKGAAALKFKELAEAALPGKVKVEVYPNSQLYKDNEEIEALQLGSVQMLAPSLSKFGPLGLHEFEVFDLPFIFPNQEAFKAVTDGPVGADLMGRLGAKGLKGLAFWDNGSTNMSANRPLHLPADFQGLKMRIQSSKVLEAQMRGFGAIPQVMAFSELYQSLQTGVVDGMENTPSNYLTQKFYEVQKHMTLSHHGHLAYAVIVNKAFWEGLPADIRPALEKALQEATKLNNDIAFKENEDALAKIAATGKMTIYTLTPEERAQWVGAMEPVHEKMKSRIGPEIVASAYAATGFKAN